MASGSRDLSIRMSTEDQDIEDRHISNCVFSHFKKLKVDISYAITRTFPFLERLRDHGLITHKLYEDSQDSLKNLVPVQRVVYNVLNELEKTFNVKVLNVLFSNINKKEYPGLILIYESFRNVIPDQSYLRESDEEERLEGPSGQLSLEQGTGENSIPSLPQPPSDASVSTGTTPPENGLSEQFWETEQVKRRRKDETRDKNDALGCQEANQQRAQEPEPAGAELSSQEIQIKPCVVNLVDIKKENRFFNSHVEQQAQARTNHKQESDIIEISSEDSEESNDEDKHSAMENKPVISNYDSAESSEGEDIQEATCSRSQTAPVSRFPRDENMNFQLPELPVTCGKLKGTLHKEKLKQGSSQKSIQTEDGKWLTPREFEIKGGYEASKKWKQSIRCGGHTLQELIKRGVLPNPPKTKRKGPFTEDKESSEEEPKEDENDRDKTLEDEFSNDDVEVGVLLKQRRRRRKGPIIEDEESSEEEPKEDENDRDKTLEDELSGQRGVEVEVLPNRRKTKRKGPIIEDEESSEEEPKEDENDRDKTLEDELSGQRGVEVEVLPNRRKTKRKGPIIEDEESSEEEPKEDENDRDKTLEDELSGQRGVEVEVLPNRRKTKRKGPIIEDEESSEEEPKQDEDDRNTFEDEFPNDDAEPKNSNICEVCRKWGDLFCCDTCPRSFHENCHIPPVECERNPWSCIFCEIQAIQERCRESPPCHQESEVLVKQMLPEEQLKCEFVLLKVYCDPKSSFFAGKPYYSRYGSQGPEKPMWLNKVKESLNKKMYPQVKGFVEDMRLIFQNHKELYEKNNFIRLGFQIENNFERNFKNTFSIQETSKNNS
ncbi:nuclear body protein SP140-like protein [Nycticebus coucang]|uniref:nuclear body protein SP140-like protein n=1 Tax=Nycticebus coucang TaxID=9470 RepID=UPI00234CD28E|nr:nuclear body protein SP140-like protein [Nycticebus coucang]